MIIDEKVEHIVEKTLSISIAAYNVEEFLKNTHAHLKGVVVSGSMERHADTYCFAGDIIAKEYNVPCLYKVDGAGTQEDVTAIQELLSK